VVQAVKAIMQRLLAPVVVAVVVVEVFLAIIQAVAVVA
jgi:hypothetical protein